MEKRIKLLFFVGTTSCFYNLPKKEDPQSISTHRMNYSPAIVTLQKSLDPFFPNFLEITRLPYGVKQISLPIEEQATTTA